MSAAAVPVPAVRVHGLTRRYGSLAAVDGLNLEVLPGEMLTVL